MYYESPSPKETIPVIAAACAKRAILKYEGKDMHYLPTHQFEELQTLKKENAKQIIKEIAACYWKFANDSNMNDSNEIFKGNKTYSDILKMAEENMFGEDKKEITCQDLEFVYVHLLETAKDLRHPVK